MSPSEIEENGLPVLILSLRMSMARLLYRRIYETRFKKSDCRGQFGEDFENVYDGYK
jgi:hypothetical protein